MAKSKKKYICNKCESIFDSWFGKCPNCQSWSSLKETSINKDLDNNKSHRTFSTGDKFKNAIKLNDITIDETYRVQTDIKEFDRVLGGGIVEGSFTLIGGEPGIGKSTILLEIANNLANKNKKVLYVSAEESASQIKSRADRLGISNDNIIIYCETSVDKISEITEEILPNVLIIDSIQTIYKEDIQSACGSPTQIKEAGAHIMYLSKGKNISTFLVGHVTKDGDIAGPKLLEHMVDTVLYFEGDKNFIYRILRSYKNRFGSTNEIGIFEMKQNGLKEVENSSRIFLKNHNQNHPGTSFTCILEGVRPIIIEIQALVNNSFLPNPKRMSIGVDKNKLSILIAILEKKANLKFYNKDIFINVPGGLKLNEQCSDLSSIASMYSSLKNIIIPSDYIFLGEVGLTGEIRNVYMLKNRLNEIKSLGFSNVVLSANNKNTPRIKGLTIYKINSIKDLINLIDGFK